MSCQNSPAHPLPEHASGVCASDAALLTCSLEQGAHLRGINGMDHSRDGDRVVSC